MALINCPECGREVSDTAKTCPHCGCALKSILNLPVANKHHYKRVAICIAVCLIAFCAIKILLRPNMKMDDFTGNKGKFSILLFLGIPSESDGDEWRYDDCGIKFYDIPIESISYDFSNGEYSFVILEQFEDNLRNTLSKYCDYNKRVYSLNYYTYKDLEVSVSYDPYLSVVTVCKP